MKQKITQWSLRSGQVGKKMLMAALFLTGTIAHGQVLIDEDFSNPSANGWTTEDVSGSGSDWVFDNPGSRDITGPFEDDFAIFDSDYWCNSDEEGILESPEFDASIAGVYQLEFDNSFRAYDDQEGRVEVWDGSSWTEVVAFSPGTSDGYPNPPSHKIIDITAAVGNTATAKIRFHFANGSCDYWWAVDNVTITRLVCTTPSATTTAASSNDICLGNTVTLSLATQTSGALLQWQSSADGNTYAAINGATGATYTTMPTASLYYRCMITCTLGPTSIYSTPVQINFSNNISTTEPGSRCGTGTVTLGATGNTGSTLNWYTALTGGTAIGTGTTFTTPVINNTTDFYVGSEVIATGDVTLGAGATTSSDYDGIFDHGYGGAQTQFLVKASELTALGLGAGDIASLGINMSTIDPMDYEGFAVSIGTTNNVDMSNGLYTGTLTQVYSSPSYAPTTGINTFDFSTPFDWDGTSNLIIKFCWSNNNYGGTDNYAQVDDAGFVACAYFRADNETSETICEETSASSTSSNRPQFIFNGQTVCSSPRMPVTATVNQGPIFTVTPNQTICNNAITTLSVTSNVANYDTYTWSPAANLYTNSNATTAYTAGSSATTVYFKSATPGEAIYTVHANDTNTGCAAEIIDTLTVLPAQVSAVATPASICISGSTTFSLEPPTGYGDGLLQWESSTNNSQFADVNGATATDYTTPTLTNTSYYRAVIKNSAGNFCLNSSSDTARVYNPLVTGTTPGNRCGTGSVILGGTASEGILNWYAAASGGSVLGSGVTFNTPSISTTTTFYVSAAAGGTSGTATVGTGEFTSVSGNPDYTGVSPYAYHYGNYKHQMLLTADELIAAGINAGTITSLAFDVVTAGNPVADFNNFNISLIPTTVTELTATFETGGTNVYSAASVTPSVGMNTYTFTTPFVWDGTTNIVVQTCYNNNNSGEVESSAEVKYDETNFISQNIYRADGNQNSICSETSGNSSNDGPIISKRPKMVLGYNSSCEGPRVAVIATINPTPSATISPAGPVEICTGSSTTLTGSGTGSYQWMNAAGSISAATNTTYVTGTQDVYRLVVTAPVTGCKDTSDEVAVNVNPIPVVSIGNDTTFCAGNTLTLDAGNTGSTYLWDNATTNQTRNITTSGTYYVKVTNPSNCIKRDTIHVTVHPTPVINLGPDTALCLGVNYVLNAGNPSAAYLWDNGTTAQTRTVNTNGTYYVKVTNSFNCAGRDTVTTTFLPTPVVNLGNDIDECAGATITLDAGNPGQTYLWDDGSDMQTRSVTMSGTYSVTVSNIANCKDADTIDVIVRPLPIVDLGNDTVICHDVTFTLNAGNPGATYLWNDNSTAQTLNIDSTGNYSVVVTDIYSCIGTDDINILVKDPPSGIINAVHGDTATYTFNVLNPQYVTGYTWNFGDGTPSVTGPIVQHRYTANGIYLVTVNLEGECSDNTTNTRTVDVYDAEGTTGINQVEDDKNLILYPNPARDQVIIETNGNLKLKHIIVYNVIGQMLYDDEADNENKHKLKTSGLSSGIYTIRIDTDKGFVIRKFEIMK